MFLMVYSQRLHGSLIRYQITNLAKILLLEYSFHHGFDVCGQQQLGWPYLDLPFHLDDGGS